MAEISSLSTTDASNNGSAANAGFAENMNYSSVNNAARALEGILARWYADTNGTLATTGSANTYLLAPNQTVGAYANGLTFLIEINADNTGASTLNVSSLGAKALVTPRNKSALVGGELQNQGRYIVCYDGTDFVVLNPSTGGLKRKAADESVANDVLQDDNHFTGFNIAAATTYRVTGQLAAVGSSGGTDIQMAWSFGGGAPQTSIFQINASLGAGTLVGATFTAGNVGTLTLDANGSHIITLSGIILGHASTAGTVKLTWAEGTDSAGSMTLKAGSWIQIEEVTT